MSVMQNEVLFRRLLFCLGRYSRIKRLRESTIARISILTLLSNAICLARRLNPYRLAQFHYFNEHPLCTCARLVLSLALQ
jgi:hypothetical protein